MLKEFLILLNREFKDRIVKAQFFPKPITPVYTPDYLLSPKLRDILRSWGIKSLYKHQYLAISAIKSGKDVFLTTGTGSGKSLVYQILLKEELEKDPSMKALYISPLKALAQDQRNRFSSYSIVSECYDGDTPIKSRKRIKEALPSVILTNPDMLHLGILPYHKSWQFLFSNLKYVILDEVHVYRGAFGSHVAALLSRLRRLLRNYKNNEPKFILLSATLPHPEEFYSSLLCKDKSEVELIEESTAPCLGKQFLLWQPKLGALNEALFILKLCIKAGLRTILFLKSRRALEILWQKIKEEGLGNFVLPYRAGYSDKFRREVENKLFYGDINGVISTSALEEGIDVGSLEVCILVGYPGSMLSTLHRAGRVGRWLTEEKGTPTVILIAEDDALDQYFISHPDEFFLFPPERLVLDSDNLRVLEEELLCAAAEAPIDVEYDSKFFGPNFHAALARLYIKGKIFKENNFFYSKIKYPHRDVNIRGVGESFKIIEEKPVGATHKLESLSSLKAAPKQPVDAIDPVGATHKPVGATDKKNIIGSIDSARLLYECYPEAIYIHCGKYYRVKAVKKREVFVEEAPSNCYTEPLIKEELRIITPIKSENLSSILNLGYGLVEVKESVVGYLIKGVKKGNLLKEVIFDTPIEEANPYFTYGLWFYPLSSELWEKNLGFTFMGGMHALEHGLIAAAPFIVVCSREDLGGRSYYDYPPFSSPAIFVYDAHVQGLGLSSILYDKFFLWLKKTKDLIESCRCREDSGCPACVQSPKCGNRNRPLNKYAATKLINLLLQFITGGKREDKVIFFSLETKYLAEEVGGWANKDKLKLAVGVVYYPDGKYKFYDEDSVYELIEELEGSVVIGFNLNNFHLKVLEGYLNKRLRVSTIDILEYVESKVGIKLPFSTFVESTLNKKPPLGGEEIVKLYRSGRIEEVKKNCLYKVKLIEELYRFGEKNKFIYYTLKKEGVRFKLPWCV